MSLLGDYIAEHIPDYNPKSKMIEDYSQTLDDRIDLMIEMILEAKEDARIRQLAGNILREAGIMPKDSQGEVCAVFNWVRENVRYTRDIRNIELFQKPIRTLEMKIGDCDDQAMILSALLECIGYPTMLKVVGISSKEPEHIYILAGFPVSKPTTWIALDPTENHPCGWEVEKHLVKSSITYTVDDDD